MQSAPLERARRVRIPRRRPSDPRTDRRRSSVTRSSTTPANASSGSSRRSHPARERRLAARRIHARRRREPHGRRHRPVRPLPRRGWLALPFRARRSPWASTPVHDHLAWGLVGIYSGEQHETVYRRLDDGHDEKRARLEVAKEQTLSPGEFYPLIPPVDDIHYVRTTSAGNRRSRSTCSPTTRPACGATGSIQRRERWRRSGPATRTRSASRRTARLVDGLASGTE